MRPASASASREHIISTPGMCGGKPCIRGTRIRVADIAHYTNTGQSPDEILLHFPDLTLSDVHAALAYYYDSRETIESQQAANDRLTDELHAALGPGPLRQMDQRTSQRRRTS